MDLAQRFCTVAKVVNVFSQSKLRKQLSLLKFSESCPPFRRPCLGIWQFAKSAFMGGLVFFTRRNSL